MEKAEKTGMREQELNEIIDFAEKYDVKKVVLFGVLLFKINCVGFFFPLTSFCIYTTF